METNPLNLAGTVATLIVAISAVNLVELQDIGVYPQLRHPLCLGQGFLRQVKTRMQFGGVQPRLMINGENYSLIIRIVQGERKELGPPKERSRGAQ